MAKKQEIGLNTILIGLLVIALFYGGSHGWFSNFSINKIYPPASPAKIRIIENPPPTSETCTLSIVPSSLFVGEEITGTIYDGVNRMCEVYANDGSGWVLVYEGMTDATGVMYETEDIGLPGTLTFVAVCGECVTNQVTIVVNEGPETDVETYCAREGYDWATDKVDYSGCISTASSTCSGYSGGYEFGYLADEEWCCYNCLGEYEAPPGDFCHDEDGGLNYEVSGRCQSLKDGRSKDYGDNCPSWFKVNEVSCIAGECAITLYECPSGECVDGACVPMPDTDGDGVSDEDEIAAGTNPNDPNSYPGGPLEACADLCKDSGFAGATYAPGGTDNSCMGYGYNTCFPVWGAQYESSDQINDCCCFSCVGW